MPSRAASFEAILARELLRAERAKATAMAALLAALIVVATVLMLFAGGEIEALSARAGLRFLIPLVLAAGVIYELACRAVLGRAIARGAEGPASLPYVSAFVEASIPSVAIAIACQMLSPAEALSSPALLAYAPFLALLALRLDARLCTFGGLVAAAGYAALALTQHEAARFVRSLFHTSAIHVARAALLLAAGAATGLVAREIRRRIVASIEVVEDRARVVGLFGRYVTDEVADVILASPDAIALGGERREITLLMTDLRGFSELASTLAPEAIVAVLNRYLGVMTTVVVEHGGTIDEIIGDAIFVLFGAPVRAKGHADRAVACAIAMQRAMPGVNAWNAERGHPALEMGIGVHTGEVILGTIGSEKRSKYGVVGTNVNLVSRIESYAVGGQVLASQATIERLTAEPSIDAVITVEPKGARGSVTLHDVTGLGPPFDVAIDRAPEALVTLPAPIDLRVRVLRGKEVGGEATAARFIRLGEREGEMDGTLEAPLLANLRIEIQGAEGDDIFGKITARDPDTGAIRVRFTSQGAAARARIARVLEGAA